MTLTDTEESFVNQAVNAIIPNEKFDNFFVYYALRNILEKVKKADTGASSGRENVSKSNFMKLQILAPSEINIQKKIASILSAYDDLIENNLKRIQLLEEAAQRIYKEWFVDFKFPNHENTPINKETGLPEGWGKKKLIEIYNKLESGKRPKGGINKDLKDGVPSIGAESVNGLGNFEFSKTKFLTEEFYSTIKKGILENKDILIYKDGAYIGKTALYQNDFPYSKCAVNEHVFLLNTKKYYSKMQNLNSNAAQPGINQKKLLQLELYLPLIDENMANFNDLVGVKITQIYKLASVNYRLKEARDLLLPRLMNRTLEV
jgi:type I restriction enzyme S subunit